MTPRLLLAVLAALSLAACDRAVIAPVEPALTVLSPDLGVVQTQSEITLRLSTNAGSRIAAVRVGGEDAVAAGETFAATVDLRRGLTALPLEGLGDDGERLVLDTAYVLFAQPTTTLLPNPEGLTASGGFTATPLDAVRVLVAGGEPQGNGDPATAAVLSVGASQLFLESEVPLGSVRMGHTATRTPDGDVLLIGGATQRRPRATADFVSTVELFVPSRNQTREVFLVGGTVRRSGHTTRALTIDGVLYLYLIGGVVPTEPPTVARSFDVLRFEPGGQPRLVVLSPPGGAGDLVGLPAPVLLDGPAAPNGTAASRLYGLADTGPAGLRLDWTVPGTLTYPVSLTPDTAETLVEARTDAASAPAGEGLFLITGGLDADGATLGSIEAVAFTAGRAFALDAASGLSRPRSGHAATILGPGRILSLGGYDAAGFPIVSPEITLL